ncbi:MAG: hypothetical protein U9N39_07200 [Campylobacterota bacterium]|nr:hypothetical protein [Campylobacterota bacterium]
MRFFLTTVTLIFSFLMSGCAPKQAMIQADLLVANGHYKKAAEFTNSEIDDDLYAKDNLLWYLQNGSASLFADDYNASIEAFDKSELLIKHYREQILAKDITQGLTSTLLNDTTRPYIGTQYDGIMANTYKALDYMALGDTEGARVEFNRAIDRQRRAKIYFSEMIQKERKAIQKEEKKSQREGKNLNVSDSEIDSILQQNYPSLHAFEPYPDFINPATTYMAGLFAHSDSNANRADSLFKETYGMVQNRDVKADLEGKRDENMVWLIFENGQGPILKEWRIDFPLWIFTNKLSYISVALPKLIERKNAYSHLNIKTNNKIMKTEFLSSMDRVIKTEFAKNYSSIVNRAILSTATKAAINYTIQEQANNNGSALAALISVASAIYQVASTKADTRIWSTLPKEFQLARFKRPKNGCLEILTPDKKVIKSLKIPKTQNTLIYVKIATPNSLVSLRVIPF